MSKLSIGPMAGVALSLGACSQAAEPALARKRVPFDPSDYKASTQAYLKLFGSLGNERIRRWFTGKVYGYRPGEPTIELFYQEGFMLSDYKIQEDGTHLETRYEILFHRDIKTGELLEVWDNPFTGRKDSVAGSVGGPQYKVFNDWGFSNPKTPRTADNPLELEWMVFGDDAWVTWDLFLRLDSPLQPDDFPLRSPGETVELVNLTNYKGKLSDIEDPDMLSAPGVMIWNGVSSWNPFMRMGQTPGTLIYKCIGVKLESFKDIPQQVYNAAEKAFPGHLSEDVPWKTGSYSWWEIKRQADEAKKAKE